MTNSISIRDLDSKQLIEFVNCIPETVEMVDLSHNRFFQGKSAWERKMVDDAIGFRVNLEHNGKTVLAKVRVSLSDLMNKQVGAREIVQNLREQIELKEPSVTDKLISRFVFFGQGNVGKEVAVEPVVEHLMKP